jgi:DNA polymerase-3 subunit epsilon
MHEQFFIDTIKRCQSILASHVEPKGTSPAKTINQLLSILDHEGLIKKVQEAEMKAPVIPQLNRPLCCIDLETTGVDCDADMIVEITVLKLFPDGTEHCKTQRLNPLIPIPPAATAVHGITDEMVKDCPTFAQVSKSLLELIVGCDILGFNSNRFDVPMLSSAFLRSGLFWDWRASRLIDSFVIFKRKEERNLSSAAKFYLEKEHETAHSAEGDIKITKEIFFQQLAKYPDLSKNMDELMLFCCNDEPILDFERKFKMNAEGKVVFSFGKYLDQEATKHKDFLQWMMTKDFKRDTKEFVKKLLMA